MAKKKNDSLGKLSTSDIKTFLSKKFNSNVISMNSVDNPATAKEWISTGSTWLDGITCKGKIAGIPVGKITTIAGLPGTGKSFLAGLISANAQKKGISVVYFDSEASIDSEFLEKAGCDTSEIIYINPENIESVFETMEFLLFQSDNRFLFILDSLANTPSKSEMEGDYNPQSNIAPVSKIMSRAFKKLTILLAQKQSTFLVLNQLKTMIASQTNFEAKAKIMTGDIYYEPGGYATEYASSLRIRLTGRKGKSGILEDENGFPIGSEVKAKIVKSRFGSLNRECSFKLLWGDNSEVKICNEDSLFDAISKSSKISNSGSWYTLGEYKFQKSKFAEIFNSNEGFKTAVMDIFEEEVVQNFANKVGEASKYCDIDSEGGS